MYIPSLYVYTHVIIETCDSFLVLDGDAQLISAINLCASLFIFGRPSKPTKRQRDEWHAISKQFSEICNLSDDGGVTSTARSAIGYIIHNAETATEFMNAVEALQKWLMQALIKPIPKCVHDVIGSNIKFTQAHFTALQTWIEKVVAIREDVALPWRMQVRSMDSSSSTRCEAEFRAVKRNKDVGSHCSLQRLFQVEQDRDQQRQAERTIYMDRLCKSKPSEKSKPLV